MNGKTLLIVLAMLTSFVSIPAIGADKAPITVAVSIRTVSNEYQMQYVAGAQAFIDSLPEGTAELRLLSCEASDDKQINDIDDLIKEKGKNAILFIDPNSARNLIDIAELCETGEIYWSSAWNIPSDINPLQYKYWVTHQACDGVKQGYDIATELFSRFETPGEGNLLVLQGMLSNTANTTRMQGFTQALMESEVVILETQACDWDSDRAKAVMENWLIVYDDIDGVWCANDNMALGAIEALTAAGLNGKVKVVGVNGVSEAVNAIESGDMVCSIGNNGWLQAGYGLAYAHAALTGKFSTEKLERRQRIFYTNGIMINNSNIDAYRREFLDNAPVYDYSNLDFPIAKEMK